MGLNPDNSNDNNKLLVGVVPTADALLLFQGKSGQQWLSPMPLH